MSEDLTLYKRGLQTIGSTNYQWGTKKLLTDKRLTLQISVQFRKPETLFRVFVIPHVMFL